MTGKTESYGHFEYEITDDPEFINEMFRIPEEVQLQFPSLHAEALEGGEKVIGRLKKLIERYPGIPQLKNYLTVAYHFSGMSDEAYELNRQIVREHPDYLFGKLNLAFEYYDREQYDRIPEVLGKVMEIKDLYPERKRFHLAEVTGFFKAAIMYFCATGKLEAADRRYEIMEKIAPDHPDTEQVFPHIVKVRLEMAEKQWKEEERTRISVVSEGPGKKHQTAIPPEFINKEIHWLYENDMRIDPGKLKQILSLDRDELIRDLRAVLKDSIYRFEYFSNVMEEEGWQEEKVDFALHAVYLLGELRATQCLPDVLETFSQGEESIELWYGDFITGNLWEPLYYIGNNQLPLLKEFVLTPGIDTYARTEVCSCITQVYHHHPERKQEVADWFRDLFTSLAAARLNDNIVDSDFIALAICDAMELTDPSLLPEIRDLYRLGYVSQGICGSYEQIERDFTTPRVSFQKRELLNIFDRYHEIITTWAGYTEEDEAEDGAGVGVFEGTANLQTVHTIIWDV
ncbi:MAG: DUF1186 domain-containing protein [Bacteroidales bacterium]